MRSRRTLVDRRAPALRQRIRCGRLASPYALVGAALVLAPAPGLHTGAAVDTDAATHAPRTAAAQRGAPAAGHPLPAPLAVCAADGPEYYAIELVTTRNIPGTAYTRGRADVVYARSPFGVSVAPDGSYLLKLRLRFERLPEPRRGAYVAWVTTPEVDAVRRIGVVDPAGVLEGEVTWNKFLVVVTLEESDDPSATSWRGPVVARGMSRSGMMHTMAGHGPFQQENCAAYGFTNG